MAQAIGVILASQVGAPAGARAQLRLGDGIDRTVVRIQARDHTIANVGLQQATPATIVGRAAGADDALDRMNCHAGRRKGKTFATSG
jgi:hypothetical protein